MAALLRTLVDASALSLDRRGATYFPAPRMGEIFAWVRESWLPEPGYLARLQVLRDVVGETVVMWTVNDLEIEVVTAVQGPHPISLTMNVGYRFPIGLTSVSVAYLLGLAPPVRAGVLRRLLRTTPRQDQSHLLSALSMQISEARAKGYAVAYGRMVDEAGAISLSAPKGLAPRPLIVTVGGPAGRIRVNEQRIAAQLGAFVN